MTLQIRLLGPVRLQLDSHLLQVNAPPKTLPLLGYLLLHRDQVLERQQVAFALWPDDPESDARANLRRHIHQLQRALPAGPAERPWLVSDARTICWNPNADYWLDVAELESLSVCPDRLEEAAGLYQGDLLEAFYDDWIFFERERLRGLFLDLLARLAGQQRAQGNFPKAILTCQQLLQQDPFREDILRQLVSLRYESGDRAGALQEYEAFEHNLRDEMGVAPMPETRALVELVRRNARLPSKPLAKLESEIAPFFTSVSPNLLPFVGREREMQNATTRWQRAVRGHGGLLLIGGEAGIGKSRMAREIALHAESQGARILYGGVSPGETRPYQPVVEALEAALPLLEGLELSSTRMAALASLLPQLNTQIKLPALPSLEPDRERIRLFDAVAACLEALAEPRPLLFILEDLHWAGETTLALMEFLVRRAAWKPILLLGTYRDEETPRSHPLRRLRRALQDEALADHLALGRLSQAGVDELLAHLPAGWLPEQSDLGMRLFAESEGNPLWIDQLLDAWSQPVQSSPEIVPGGIRSAILSRLERLSEGARAFAEVAAILGPAFDAEVVREVGGWDEATAHLALSSLLDSRLVRDTEGRSHFDYLFSHHLFQATLYGEITPAKRARRHLRAAEVLEELYPQRRLELIGELARHFDLGGNPAQALPCYLENARRQFSLFANSEALASIQRALDLEEKLPDICTPRNRFDLLLLSQEIYHRKGMPKEEWRVLLALQDLAVSLEEPALEFEVIQRQIEFKRDQRELAHAFLLLEKLRICADKLNSPYWHTLVTQTEGQLNVANSTYEKAIPLLQEAMAAWEKLGNRSNQLYCICYLADIAHLQRNSKDITNLLQKALALRDESISPAQLMRTLLSAANAGVVSHDPPHTLLYARQLVDLAERVGDLGWQATGKRLIGIANSHLFNIQQARESLNKAAQIFFAIQRIKPYAQTLESLGLLEASVGRFDQARQYYLQALEILQRMNQLDGVSTGLINLAYACSLQEKFGEEYEYAQKALESSRQLKNRFLEALALQALGDASDGLNHPDAALTYLMSAEEIMRQLDQAYELTGVLNDRIQLSLKMDNLAQALEMSREILLLYPKIEGTDNDLHRFLWTAARAFRAARQEELSSLWLAKAYEELQRLLKIISDDETRKAFAQIPYNLQIAEAQEKRVWP